MSKWLAIGGVLLVVLLLILWREMRPTEARTAPAGPRERAATPEPLAAPGARPTAAAVAPAAVAAAAPAAAPADGKPAKLDPRSDEFFYKFDETIPKVLTRNAAKCYEGRHGSLHRNQKLSLRYKVKVVNGDVVVQDVTIKESTLKDTALETCFIQQVQRSTWKDDELPDVAIDDELVLRPERGMKKYWQDNIDYIGAEAPRN
ncbi:MAG TPA: hypothetical protein VFK02_08705 [Kofleriaceae bacterium]|nr:hypothetical protein [Kofleriaceae bacterium]